MKIGNADTHNRTFVIAEIGNNHEGSVDLAEELIGLAAKAGADAVKFQTIAPENLVSSTQTERIAQLNRICLKRDQFPRLAKTAAAEGIQFLSTPFDLEAVDFLNEWVPAFKIASGDNDFYPLIEKVASSGKPVIVSAGMLDEKGILKVIGSIKKIRPQINLEDELCVMHCVAKYPVDLQEAQLASIRSIEQLGVTPGYSDHTIGADACVAAVAVGAQIIEKHFTIRNDYSDFRDHQLSADPETLKTMIERIRLTEQLLGRREKFRGEGESASENALRRSIVARTDMAEGDEVTLQKLNWVRPMNGLRPGKEDLLIGKKMTVSVKAGELITQEMVKD